MHELSICRAIAATVQDHADGRPVTCVRLRIGYFRQIVPDTLAYCWQLHTRDSDLEGCVLDVDYIPAVIQCHDCGARTELRHPVLRCGSCDSTSAELISGEEFLIESIDLRDDRTSSEA